MQAPFPFKYDSEVSYETTKPEIVKKRSEIIVDSPSSTGDQASSNNPLYNPSVKVLSPPPADQSSELPDSEEHATSTSTEVVINNPNFDADHSVGALAVQDVKYSI